MKRNDSVVDIFNKEVKERGGYLYTKTNIYSARVANKRLTNETVYLIRKYFRNNPKILDVGCGDGTYTIEVLKRVRPDLIVGIDPSKEAIKIAKKKVTLYDKRVVFKVGDIYNVDKEFIDNQFDLVIVRGVLHHLDYPQRAIKKISGNFRKVIVIEPNGYNLLLKIYCRLSIYHKTHQEKSYSPLLLRMWFKANGYSIKEEYYVSLVPYFCNEYLARFLKYLQRYVENIPFLKQALCLVNISFYEKI